RAAVVLIDRMSSGPCCRSRSAAGLPSQTIMSACDSASCAASSARIVLPSLQPLVATRGGLPVYGKHARSAKGRGRFERFVDGRAAIPQERGPFRTAYCGTAVRVRTGLAHKPCLAYHHDE